METRLEKLIEANNQGKLLKTIKKKKSLVIQKETKGQGAGVSKRRNRSS
jgi:hypothetical protein